MDASDLDTVLVSNGLELFFPGRELGKLDVHRSPQGSAKVGGTGSDVTKVVIVTELGHGLDVCNSSAQSLEDGSDIGSLLHGDDSELILLVHPHKEGFCIIVEDSTTRRPVPVDTTCLKESISFPVKEDTYNDNDY